jgi:signal transduction histidine kinase
VDETTSGELGLEPLLTHIVESAAQLIGAGHGSIGLVCETTAGPVVRTVAVYNMPDQELGAETPLGVGLAGQVLYERRPLWFHRYGDLQQPLLPEFADHTVIGMPIWWDGQMIGFLGIGAAPPYHLDPQAIATLELFARHASSAIVNARLLEAERRRGRRIAIINRISRLITSTLSLNAIFQTAVEAICEQFSFAYVAAGVVDNDDPEMLVLLAHTGIFVDRVPTGYRQSIHAGIIGEVARSRSRILINNTHNDSRYLALLGDEICAELAMPIVVGERFLGVLNIESRQLISEEDAEGLAIIADQLAIAMDNARLFASTQQTLEETRLLYATSQRISSAMNVEEVIAAYLQQVATRGRYSCTIVLYEYNMLGDRTERIIRGHWNMHDGLSLFEYRAPYTADALDPPLDAGITVTISDVRSDPRAPEGLRQMQAESGRTAVAMIPMMIEGRRIGLVVLAHTGPHGWPEADLQPYQATSAQLAIAIHSRMQQRQLVASEQQIAVLEERRRLAQELHDSVTQSLFSMSLLSQVVPELWEVDQPEARSALAQIRDLTRSALAEMRALLFELRPTALQDQDLVPAIRQHAAAFESRAGIQVIVDAETLPKMHRQVEQTLFRIVQEALSNVARHAHAHRVRLTMVNGPPLRLIISDDGEGFDVNQVGLGHFGLVSMRERAVSIGARIEIQTSTGQGTSIIVEWPDSTNKYDLLIQ